MMHAILRVPVVRERTELSRSTIYLRIAQGTFPKPVNLGGRAVGWLEAEIQDWLQRRIDASRLPVFRLHHRADGVVRTLAFHGLPSFRLWTFGEERRQNTGCLVGQLQ